MAKKFLSILLTLVLVLGLLPAAGAAALSTSPTFSDMPDNWATEALESAVANGLLVGDDGKIMPDSPLTRAQMATIIARAFGATKEGDISEYADVKSTDWFAGSMAKAYKMGVMQGYAGKMEPNSNISREQAFAVLARALKLEPASVINKTYEDEWEISDWAKAEVYALVNAGYIQGSNGKLNPQANISRAEFAQMMHNLIKQYIKAEGEYTQVADGNIMVNVPNVTLKNVTITGDLIVGDGVGDGDLILDNVTIKGRFLARGGGVNSIIIIGGSVEGKVIVAKVDGDIRVSVEGGADVEVIVIDDGKDDVIIEGTVGTVEVSVPDVPVIIQNATISKIDVNCEGAADITIAETGSVTNVVIGGNSEGTALNVEGNVTNIETSAPDTVISGTGAVGTVTANEGADNTSVTTPNTVVNNEGASAVTAGGGKEVPEDSSATNNNQGTDVITTPPSGGSGGGPSYVAVSAISVDEPFLLVKADENELTDVRTIKAIVSPASASNKRVTWSSDNEEVATVDENGVVTGIKGGTATITVTSVADSSKKATVHVVVGDILVPAHFANPDEEGTLQGVIDAAPERSVIAVAPGTYNESITIDRSLTLLGPNADIAGTGVRNAEAVITYPDELESTNDKSLVYITADDVVIKGLSFITEAEEEGSQVREIWFTGYDNEFSNNRVISFNDKVAVHFGIADSYKEDNTRYFNDITDNNGTIVKDNYIKSTSSWSALYLQGRAGIVEGNTIDGGLNAIQIQPYWNGGNGTVRNNKFYGYDRGIWHNRADFGSGSWIYEDNYVYSKLPTNVYRVNPKRWMGIAVQSHGTEGWGGNQPTGDGTLPELAFINNVVDGIAAIDNSEWDEVVGAYFFNNVSNLAEYDFEDNTFANVDTSVWVADGIANLELLDVFDSNNFPDGFNVLGNQIKMLEDGKIYISNTGVEYATIQAAIDAATAGDTILVGDGDYTEYLTIDKAITLKSVNGRESTEIAGTITITADNVTVDGFTVTAPAGYNESPVIHMINVADVNILNNTVVADATAYGAIGTSTGPAKVTGIISGNDVTGMIMVGTDGAVEVSNNNVTLTTASTEGICFYPVGSTAEITVTGNTVGQVTGDNVHIKVNEKPLSVNGETNEVDMLAAITADNNEATAKLGWFTLADSTVAVIGAMQYNSLEAAINAAIDKSTINILKDCTIVGATANNKDLTFVGNSSKPKVTFPQKGYQTYYGCEFTFENLTLECAPDENYQGIQPDKLIAKNCVINGKFWGYAKDLEFTDCVFNQNSSYNIWTYGSNVTFDNCEFNSAGRSVLIYNEGATLAVPAEIVFKNCTFSASTPVDKKAAIDIDTRFGSFNIEIENCSASGFSEVTESGGETIIPGFIHLKATDKGTLTVTVGGMQVYQLVPVTEVSLDRTEIILVADEIETLTATVGPANATNKEVTWTSSDETVATVDENGKVTAVAQGTSTITVTTSDGSHTATTEVTVPAESTVAMIGTTQYDSLREAVDVANDSKAEVIMIADVTIAGRSGGYDVAGLVLNGAIINGNGNTLTVTDANGTWDCAIFTTGGTIKNLTVGGAFRGIFTDRCSEDIIIDNVVLDNVCYTFSSDGSNPNYSLIVTNSTLNGWTSFTSGYKSVSFNDCIFGKGTGGYQYAYMRPYSDTAFSNCVFSEGYELDARQTDDITLYNCTVGGVKLTQDNLTTLLGADAAKAKVLTI